jgi:hypothetical protein
VGGRITSPPGREYQKHSGVGRMGSDRRVGYKVIEVPVCVFASDQSDE